MKDCKSQVHIGHFLQISACVCSEILAQVSLRNKKDCVSTVGLDAQVIRDYIRNPEQQEISLGAAKISRTFTIAPLVGFHHATRISDGSGMPRMHLCPY